MKVLVSTFGPGDEEKVVLAMRSLPYDHLVLIGEEGVDECDDLHHLREMEDMAGHSIDLEVLEDEGFMELVDSVAGVLQKHSLSPHGGKPDSVRLNMSGGSKLLGDAALLAAFRLGVETFYCEGKVTKLPVIKGATARDRFTASQIELITTIADRAIPLGAVVEKMATHSRQAVERVIRELKKEALIRAEVKAGKVLLSLSESGAEVLRSLRSSMPRE